MERAISDGFGSTWLCCNRQDCDLEIVRPGKVQCSGEWDDWGCDFGGQGDDPTDGTMVDLGGGMVVPLSELLEDD